MASLAAKPRRAAQSRRLARGMSERRLAFFMVSPAMLVIAVVAIYPIGYALWMSLHEYSVRVAGLSRWAGPLGLRNYTNALADPAFWSSLWTTLTFAAASVSLELVLGLAMAMAMHAAFRGQSALRTVVLVPWAVLTVVTAIMWRSIFDANLGVVNSLLGMHTIWLGQEPHALIVTIVADVWKTAPFMALLLLAGLQVIPDDVYDAAKVDGATPWQRFFRITLPLLTPSILVALIFRTMEALQIFDLPYVLTRGANGTTTLSLLAERTFAENRIYGLGAALSVLTFLVVMLVSLVYIRTVGRNMRGLAEA